MFFCCFCRSSPWQIFISFMAFYFVPLIMAFVYIAGLSLFVYFGYLGPFDSNEASLSYEKIPLITIHLSDTHVTPVSTSNTEHITSIFSQVIQLSPDMLFVTGDLIDGRRSKSYFSLRGQYENNLELLNSIIDDVGVKTSGIKTFFVAGNHDMLAVNSNSDEDNLFKKYFVNESDDYYIQVDDDHSDYRVITFNCYDPPTSSNPFGFIPYVNSSLLEKLEASFSDTKYNILLTHTPKYSLWSGKSKSGKTIRDLIGEPIATMTGHYHPPYMEAIPTKNSLMVVAPAAVSSNNVVLTTFDGSNVFAHEITPDDTDILLPTYPIPDEQITDSTIFNTNSFEARLLVYSSETQSSSAQVVIDDNQEYNMEQSSHTFSNPNFTFFRCNITVEDYGRHYITFKYEGLEESYSFYTGSRLDRYSASGRMYRLVDGWVMLTIALCTWVYMSIRLIPYWMFDKINLYKRMEVRLCSNDPGFNASTEWLALESAFFFISCNRILPLYIYAWLIFLHLVPLFLPILILPTGKPGHSNIGAAFGFGMVVKGELKLCGLFFLIWTLYIVLFQMPSMSICLAIYYEQCWTHYTFVLALAFILWCLLCSTSGGVIAFFGSPATYLYFLDIGIIALYWYKNLQRTRSKKTHSEGNPWQPAQEDI